MKTVKIVLFFLFLITLASPVCSQENSFAPQRTPEQEAVRQTEKFQQELNLTQAQAKQVYEINLRYARERQISNKRSEALERMKNKDAEIQQVLSPEQSNRLQSKRYDRTTSESQIVNRSMPMNSSGFRSSSSLRSNTTELNFRNNDRPVNPNFQPKNQPNQTIRRSTAPTFRPIQNQNNRTVMRPSSGNSNYTPKRTQTSAPNNSSPRQQSAPTNSSQRANPPANTNRK